MNPQTKLAIIGLGVMVLMLLGVAVPFRCGNVRRALVD